ncbi:MAG TPA: ABC transporter permease [Aggregatilineaceae bacterium]|nr:ABC transporter permease [Aggregatilineaceae bacterium]
MKLRRHFNRAASWSGRGLVILLASGAVLLVVLPLGALGWRSYQGHAWTLMPQTAVQQAIRLSFGTTTVSLLLILLLGTPLAYLLARQTFPAKRLVNVLVQLPIVLPPAVAGLALLITFGRRGVLGPTLDGLGFRITFTRTAVILAQTFVAMPFYVRSAQVGFRMVDREIEEAALVDGATPWWRFVYVTLPLASQAMISGALLSWARALGEFGATILFAGNLPGRTQTMPLLIYSAFERSIDAAIWTALILVGLAGLVLVLTFLLTREDDSSPTR